MAAIQVHQGFHPGFVQRGVKFRDGSFGPIAAEDRAKVVVGIDDREAWPRHHVAGDP